MSFISISNVSFSYGARQALQKISLEIEPETIFGLLGPNGGGKSTLFKILSTLIKPQAGKIRLNGFDVETEAPQVRQQLGIVFQMPSLDKKLTVRENLVHQGHLYGLMGQNLGLRVDDLSSRFGLRDRMNERVESLSGGFQRRVEIVKALLHKPKLLLLDEPSTGLDPSIRMEMWTLLSELHREDHVTIVLTTHLMDEAEKCTKLAILHQGSIVTTGTPAELKGQVSGDIIQIWSPAPATLQKKIEQAISHLPKLVDGALRIESQNGSALVQAILEKFGNEISQVSVRKPSLEDVFLHKTGAAFETSNR